MTEQETLARMIAPAGPRPSKPYRGGVIQIHVTRACDKACFACTQGSNLGGKVEFMSPKHFEQAVRSLGFDGGLPQPGSPYPPEKYFGVVGVFGGNPALSPAFPKYCEILRRLVPFEQRGLWCNHPKGHGAIMRETFNPAYSNLNVHLDREAYDEFRRDWPESVVVGLTGDSRHSPVHLAMKDVLKRPCPECDGTGNFEPAQGEVGWTCKACDGKGQVYDEAKAWELIAGCDINQHWSAMIGVFRGQLRAWFCEVAGAQAMLHQHEEDYPDLGINPIKSEEFVPWWQLPMNVFRYQVRKHCHECGVPLRGYGELSQAAAGVEQTSATHAAVFRPKRQGRPVEVVTDLVQLDVGRIQKVNHYLQNASK